MQADLLYEGPSATPDISVVIAVHNDAQYLQAMLDSIIGQKVSAEVILVDDCSDDDTVKIARLHFAKHPLGCLLRLPVNSSAYVARYEGLLRTTGRIVLIADGDDRFEPKAFRRLMKCSMADVIGFGARYQGIDGRRSSESEYLLFPRRKSVNGPSASHELIEQAFRSGGTLWSKAYNGDFIRKTALKYKSDAVIHRSNDVPLAFAIAVEARSYLGLPRLIYNYRIGAGLSAKSEISIDRFRRLSDFRPSLSELERVLRISPLDPKAANELLEKKKSGWDRLTMIQAAKVEAPPEQVAAAVSGSLFGEMQSLDRPPLSGWAKQMILRVPSLAVAISQVRSTLLLAVARARFVFGFGT